MENLKKYISKSLDEKIQKLLPGTNFRRVCEKVKENIDAIDLTNSSWKVVLNKATKEPIRQIVKGSIDYAIRKLEEVHYSKTDSLPTYDVSLKFGDVNIPISSEILKNYVKDKDKYIEYISNLKQ
jgi:vacuolar-type H+-ATPase subunit E/Vma4